MQPSPPAADRPKLLLVERRLGRKSGHHHTQLAAIQGLVPDHELRLLTGADDAGLLPYPVHEVNARATVDERLIRRLWCGTPAQRVVAGLKLAVAGRLLPLKRSGYGDDLRAALAAFGIGSADMVVVPSATLDDLGAVVDVFSRLRNAPRCVLRFLDPALGEPQHHLRDRRAAALLGTLGHGVRLFCETEEMAADLTIRYGHPVVGGFYLPCSIDPAVDGLRPSRAPDAPTRIGVFGLPRAEKGMSRIPGIVAAVARIATAPVDFVVQGQESDFASGGCYGALSGIGGLVRIERATGALAPEAFRALFLSSDAILLPYDVAVYGLQGSGLVQDAAAAGIPVVHSRGFSMRRLLCHGNAVAAETDAEFAEAIVSLTTDADAFVPGCARARTAFRQILAQHPLVASGAGTP